MSSEDYDVDLVFEEEPKPEFYEDLRKALLKKICGYGGPISRGKLTDAYIFNIEHKRKVNNTIREVCSRHRLEVTIKAGKAKIKSR